MEALQVSAHLQDLMHFQFWSVAAAHDAPYRGGVATSAMVMRAVYLRAQHLHTKKYTAVFGTVLLPLRGWMAGAEVHGSNIRAGHCPSS